MKKISVIACLISMPLLFLACGGGDTKTPAAEPTASEEPTPAPTVEDYDPTRGEGKFDASNVTLGALDKSMAEKGKVVAETKCMSCHKVSDERLVGPGWKGVTERRTAHWIMNFITNPDPMIDKDPEVQTQLELCLVRMPNQNLADEEARNILEFMRQNDGVQ